MPPDDLADIAQRVADGLDVDWAAAQAAVPPEDRALLARLRALQELASFHRTCADAESAPLPGDPGLEPGATWGHLVIRAPVARGAYGDVYRAFDAQLEREVALKILRYPERTGAHAVSRAIAEARLLARVRHPNVITIHGADRIEGQPALWMELVDGRTIADIVANDGPLSPGEAVLLGLTLCRALSAVHQAGVLHRDLKAQNVMRERGGRIILMDFGAGRDRWEAPGEGGDLAGTPLYLAPEVLAGGPATIQSDLYSLGVLLFYAASGDYPVRAGSIDEIRALHRAGHRQFLHDVRPDLPEGLARLIERALSPAAADRYRSAGEMEGALAHVLGFQAASRTGLPTRRRTLVLALASGALLAVAVAGMADGWRSDGPEPAYRRLTFRPGRVTAARFAPDAQTILYSAEWSGRPRELFSTSFGSLESRPLDVQDASVLSVSRRGELALLLQPRFLRGYVESGTLARVPVGGGSPREVLAGVQDADWSPDGSMLAIVREVGGKTRVEFPAGSPLFEAEGWVGNLRVSPDGSHLAFIDHPIPADDSGRVVLVDRRGRPTTLSDGWVSAQGLAWSPAGDEVWFTAAESGNARALHAVDLAGRRRVVLRMISKLRLHDISADGRLLVTEESTRVGIQARAADGLPERDLSWLDWSLARDLTPDGRTLLLNESGEGGGGRYAVYLRGLDGSPAVRLGEGSGLAISPDGRWVLATRPASGAEPPALFLLPAGPGEIRLLPRGQTRYQQWGAWFPDGSRVLFAGQERQGGSQVFVQDVRGGLPRALTPPGVYLTSARPLSPDATWIAAVAATGQTVLYPVAGGPVRPVPGAQVPEAPLHWSADGKALYVWRRGSAPAQVYRLDLERGTRTLWRELMPPDPAGVHEILRIVLSSDAGAYAYSYTRELSSLHLVEHVR